MCWAYNCILLGSCKQRAQCLTADPQLGEQPEEQGHAVLGVRGGCVDRQAAGLQQAPDADDNHQLPQHAQGGAVPQEAVPWPQRGALWWGHGVSSRCGWVGAGPQLTLGAWVRSGGSAAFTTGHSWRGEDRTVPYRPEWSEPTSPVSAVLPGPGGRQPRPAWLSWPPTEPRKPGLTCDPEAWRPGRLQASDSVG